MLSIRDLAVKFRIPRGVLTAVDGVDLDVIKGEVFGLSGESGCGKTVIAHAILKLVAPNGFIETGKIMFEGDDVLSMSDEELRNYRWKDVALIFQGAQSALNPLLLVNAHMLDTVLAHEKKSKSDILEGSSELTKLLRLNPDLTLGMYPHELSGGMKQRVMSAMSLLLNPKLLILDEPTTALDMLTQRYLLRILRDIHEETEITMFYITHDLTVMAELADRIGVMYLGNLVEICKTDGLFYDPLHPYTEALLNAIPSIMTDVPPRPIPGPIPDPVNPPSGCKFHPRCPQATETCEKIKPELTEVEKGRLVACHLNNKSS